jgi:hypothetical protein
MILTGQRVRTLLATASPLISQIVSSLGNVALVLLGARFLDKAEFGRFSLVYSVVLFLSQLLRAGVAESAMISKSRLLHTDHQVANQILSGGIAASLLAGTVCGFVAFLSGISAPLALALGFAGAAVPLTDITRYVYFVVRPQTSVSIDVVWGVLGILGTLVLRSSGSLSATSMLLGWGASALIASIVPIVRQAPNSAIKSLRCAIAESGARRLVIDTALLTGSSLVLLGVLATSATSAAVGEFRAAAIPFTWIQIAHAGGYLTVARRRNNSSLVTRKSTSRAIVVGVAACILTAGLLRVLPGSVGAAVLGKGWAPARSLALVVGLQYISFVVAETLMGAIKIVVGARPVVYIRVAFSLTILPLLIVVSQFPSARTAVLCLSGANLTIITCAVALLKRPRQNVVIS